MPCSTLCTLNSQIIIVSLSVIFDSLRFLTGFHRHRLQMKTVSGKLVSTTPVNLFKSVDILSDFVTSDNGASQSVSAYLSRASAAFNDPAYFEKHRNLKKNRSNQEASTKSDISCKTLEKDEVRKVAGNSMKPESKKRRRTEAVE